MDFSCCRLLIKFDFCSRGLPADSMETATSLEDNVFLAGFILQETFLILVSANPVCRSRDVMYAEHSASTHAISIENV